MIKKAIQILLFILSIFSASMHINAEEGVADRISWFPLEVLISDNWETIKEEATAYDLDAFDKSSNVGLPQKGISLPQSISATKIENRTNTALLVLVEEDGPLAMCDITDLDFRWSEVDQYPSENPCVTRFAVCYKDEEPIAAIGEMQFDDSSIPVSFVIMKNGQITTITTNYTPAMKEYYPERAAAITVYTYESRLEQYENFSDTIVTVL